MKKGLLYLGMMAVCMVFSINTLKAQADDFTYTIPETRVLARSGTAPTLSFDGATNGGAISEDASSASYLNYTSIVAVDATNKITVTLAGTVPAGTTLKIEAATSIAGNGDQGTIGSVSYDGGTANLDARDLITAIGSCYTGTGTGEGAKLTYTWTADSDGYADLRAADSQTIGITYTIAAETAL